MIGIKTCEYLACGLPIIANKNMTSLSKFIKKNQVGISFEFNKLDELYSNFKRMDKKYKKYKINCSKVAKIYFDVEKHANHYISLYEKLK